MHESGAKVAMPPYASVGNALNWNSPFSPWSSFDLMGEVIHGEALNSLSFPQKDALNAPHTLYWW